MKLIIDIPEEHYKNLTKIADAGKEPLGYFERVIMLGTPLDDVKAEMQKVRRFHVGNFEDDNPIDYGIVEGFDKAVEILNNIGKADMRGDT